MFDGTAKWSVTPVLQGAQAECGLACAAMILQSRGLPVSLQDLRQQYATSHRGTKIRDLVVIFENYGLASHPVRLELEDLKTTKVPCILHWNFDHFVILEKMTRKYAEIIDPQFGRMRVPLKRLSTHFTGVAIDIADGEAQRRKQRRRPQSLRLLDLFPHFSSLWKAFLALMLMTLSVNILALTLPFFVKIAIDEVVPAGSLNLLNTVFAAFGIVIATQFGLQLLRSTNLAAFRRHLSDHMSGEIFQTLVWLKDSYFQSRNPATIGSHYRSIKAITSTISEQIITYVIDGMAVVIGLIMILWFNPAASLVIASTIVLYGLIYVKMQPGLNARLYQSIQSEAEESAFFDETINSIQAIRLYSKELNRLNGWGNIRTKVENDRGHYGVYRQNFSSMLEVVMNVSWLVFAYVSIKDLLAGGITIGLFTAQLSWATYIINRLRDVVQGLSSLEALQSHVSRLEDILLSEQVSHAFAKSPEPGSVPHITSKSRMGVHDVWFRYGKNDNWVLKGCSFTMAPGKVTAIAGQSGEGKTTVLKILLGLLEAQRGYVSLDGHPVHQELLPFFRRQFGVVMQNDSLFMGSVVNNISFFDVTPDIDRVQECARLAGISPFIESLPMQYDSLIGRHGAGFSAGQIQRLLLARALYHEPRVLLLDEFTSNLDEGMERDILNNLRGLGIPILTIAHRPQVIAEADEIFWMQDGELIRRDPKGKAAYATH